MSNFTSGGGFAFGSNTNNQSSGFGSGFGNTSNTGGFGSTSNTAFGSSTANSNPFGSSTFGSNSGGFGGNSNTGTSLFGNKTANSNPFGSSTTTSGGLFGSSTANNSNNAFGSPSGGFGSTSNNAFSSSTNAGFGGGNAFGNKTGFGASSSSAPLFGQGGSGTTSGFGSGAFGAGGSGTALNQGAVPPAEGTALVPFTPTTDKEGPGNNQSCIYQSINFMQPYQKYSFEELRLADYNAGRRYGNGSGQAGAFGSSTFGSGFGATNTNTNTSFGSTNANPFGTNNSSSGSAAFGSGSGGLFGAKPASTGLFGQQSSGTSSAGLFGTSGSNNSTSLFNNNSSTSGGFGTNSGGSLFGNANQNKPGGLFGPSNSGTSFGFGQSNNTSNASGGGLFTNTNQSSSGLFGNQNQAQNQNQNQNKPGGLFGNSSGFGSTNNQSQPSGGLFGTNSGGGLFGNNSNANTGNSLFGANNSNNTGSSPFGNNQNQNQNQAKPSLFGNSTFGGNQQQPATGGGLFSNTNNAPSSGGLFGNNTNTSGGFSFGNQNQNKPNVSLFGNAGNTQPGGLFSQQSTNNSGSMFGSSFGQPQQNLQQSQMQQQDGIKHASLLDPNPYGQSSIWTGLPVQDVNNAKPLVTPLTATRAKQEREAKPPPSLRFSQSRYMTPPRRNGFGFSYSTYGTPNSAASTPGGGSLSTSMYGSRFTGGSFGRSMGKAASISNLRSHFSDGDSVLAPGAFTPSASRYSSGSIRRLTIDKSIKSDLFTRPPLPTTQTAPPSIANVPTTAAVTPAPNNEPPQEPINKLKKRVSFEKDVTGGQSNAELNSESGALVRTENDDDDATVNGASPPAQQPRGNELAVVPEDRESENVFSTRKSNSTSTIARSHEDPDPGDYWMKPSRSELGKLPREKLQHFKNFEVGRVGCGKVIFNEPVDLTSINLDDVYEKLVEIRVRSITVYPDPATKPPVGKGLNVPSTLYIENSWPRNRGQPTSLTSGPVFDKHVIRLKRIPGTEFVDYQASKGMWIFKVPHYTRYALDYDDDDDLSDSRLREPPDTIDGTSVMELDSDHTSAFGEDDTFHNKSVPGTFGEDSMFDDTDDSVIPTVEHEAGSERSNFSEPDTSDDDMDMAGQYPGPAEPVLKFESPQKQILVPGTPGKPLLDLDGDWADQLQRTISPRKQNRSALREGQAIALLDRNFEPIKPQSVRKKDFRTSIDVMNALFEKQDRRGQAEPDFEFPYAKRAKTFDENEHPLDDADKAFHASFKSKFTTTNKLVYKTGKAPKNNRAWKNEVLEESNKQLVCISSLQSQAQLNITNIMKTCTISSEHGVPSVEYTNLPFSQMKLHIPSFALDRERCIYDMLHALFDQYEDEFSLGLTEQQRLDYADRIRKDRLSKFLAQYLSQQGQEKIASVGKGTAAEAAFRHLVSHNVAAAAEALTKLRNYNLTMLVSQIEEADSPFQADMAAQIDAWRSQDILSEMTEDIRALYELLSGNTGVAYGKPDAPTEHRATTFSISDKYDLSWLQVFALELWYGRNKNDGIQEVVASFAKKLETQEETASPVDVYGNEDPLWVVLKLYAALAKRGKSKNSPVFPAAFEALTKPWDCSATFRLYNSLCTGLADRQLLVDEDKADELAMNYATELEMRGDLTGASFALMHLREPLERGDALHDLVVRHADRLPSPPASGEQGSKAWEELTRLLKLPEEWISQGLALLARSHHNSHLELKYLLMAGETREAHVCLCERVAPRLVIDEDWNALLRVIDLFGQGYHQIPAEEWTTGGGAYKDVASLMVGEKSMMKETRVTNLEKCAKAISQMWRRIERESDSEDLAAESSELLEQRVAIKEMGGAVAEMMDREQVEDFAAKIRELPLCQDVSMKLGGIAAKYYRLIMAEA